MTDLAPAVGNPRAASEAALTGSLAAMVAHDSFPCLGARSVFRQENATIRVYDQLATDAATDTLLADLRTFAGSVDPAGGFASFIAIFRGPVSRSEKDFERLLWEQLRRLHAADDSDWNDEVSDDPQNQHFAFSLAGTAFFVVGLHPGASRDARRTATPTLVFNLHEQFEQLRASGRFERMRDTIRDRDERLQGSVNPMVSDHGTGSEARQYSGRAVDDSWLAPFESAS
ncbi:MAG: guanitoxin biosynthesis heme-dependent pre-guanitoxin N-hydroxylase GntA [Lapillicoccus sp.]